MPILYKAFSKIKCLKLLSLDSVVFVFVLSGSSYNIHTILEAFKIVQIIYLRNVLNAPHIVGYRECKEKAYPTLSRCESWNDVDVKTFISSTGCIFSGSEDYSKIEYARL